jgi:hypothetical protein
MSLIERYVAAVKRRLPDEVGDDVGRELGSSLADAVEEFRGNTGREPTEAELEQIIRRRGHPLEVAASYQPQRRLIGPRTFPIYTQVLKGVMVLIASAELTETLFQNGGVPPLGMLWRVLYELFESAFIAFAWVTIAFFFLDSWLGRGHVLRHWNPARLRAVPRHEIPIRSGTAVAEIVFAALVLSLLENGISGSARMFKVDAPVYVGLAPAFAQWMPAVIACVIVLVGIAFMGFIDRYWSHAKLIPTIAAHGLVGVFLLLATFMPESVVMTTEATGVRESHAQSLLVTMRGLLLLAAARHVYCAIEASQLLRRLKTPGDGLTPKPLTP